MKGQIRWNKAALGRTVRIVAADTRFSMLAAVYKRWLTVGHSTRLPESCQSPAPCIAALEPHSRHKLRCNSEGLLSYSWVEIECQLDSSRSTRNGHIVRARHFQLNDSCGGICSHWKFTGAHRGITSSLVSCGAIDLNSATRPRQQTSLTFPPRHLTLGPSLRVGLTPTPTCHSGQGGLLRSRCGSQEQPSRKRQPSP